MFPTHIPAQQAFNWYCQSKNISGSNLNSAANRMRESVKWIRGLFKKPIGHHIPYDDEKFRAAYLLAYFPYYIEPIYHVLQKVDLPDSLFASGNLKAAFFGGGPCPEVLGLAAYLRKRAPYLKTIEATVFDRQSGWNSIQQELVPSMLPSYKSGHTTLSLKSKSCDVVDCLARECNCGIADKDIIIAQNFLTEVYTDKKRAMETFERLINRSKCQYIVFVDNMYDEVKDMMNELSGYLHDKGLTKQRISAETTKIHPNFRLPQVMRQHLFTGEGRLQPKLSVKFHHMVLEIVR